MLSPEVSIITCLYNAERFIDETAGSVIGQTYPDFEWLIVDDGSEDSSLKKLEALSAADARIVVFSLPHNRGPIFARNYALDRAKGRFIAILDADDLWLPDKLKNQIAFMKERRIALSYTGYRKIFENGKPHLGLTVPIPAKVSYHRVLRSDCIMASSAVYDTSLTGRIKQSYEAPVGKDDFHFFLSIIRQCGAAYGIQQDLARLRISKTSLTGKKMRAARMQWAYYRKTIGFSRFLSAAHFMVYAIKGFLKYLL